MDGESKVIDYEAPPPPAAMPDDYARHRRDSLVLLIAGVAIAAASVLFAGPRSGIGFGIGCFLAALGLTCLLVARRRRTSRLLRRIF